MARDNWSRILEREYSHASFSGKNISGEIALLRFKKVANPLDVTLGGQIIRIVDDGYYWLQVAPKNENWWITAAFDENKKPLQYYIDVTLKNVIAGGESYFHDPFLDVIFATDGIPYLFDEDELDEALELGIITLEQHKFSHSVAERLMSAFPERLNELEHFCLESLRQLSQ